MKPMCCIGTVGSLIMLHELTSTCTMFQNQEQLQDAETDGISVKLENVQGSVEGNSESAAPPDDLLEGDLGLGTCPTPAWEE